MTKLEKFEQVYKKEIKSGAWISKDDMAQKGFFPINNSNGRDIRFIKRKYKLEIIKEKTKEKEFRIVGLVTDSSTRAIRKDIMEKLRKEKCAMTGTTATIEIDHKNGRYNDERVLNVKTQTIDDFQPLTKFVNNMKREHCKKCTATGKRFDAKELGYLVSTLNGEPEHNNQPNGCEGCFFYDIHYFKEKYNEILSTNYGTQKFNESKFHDYYSINHHNASK